jgi:hypothetical protein
MVFTWKEIVENDFFRGLTVQKVGDNHIAYRGKVESVVIVSDGLVVIGLTSQEYFNPLSGKWLPLTPFSILPFDDTPIDLGDGCLHFKIPGGGYVITCPA